MSEPAKNGGEKESDVKKVEMTIKTDDLKPETTAIGSGDEIKEKKSKDVHSSKKDKEGEGSDAKKEKKKDKKKEGGDEGEIKEKKSKDVHASKKDKEGEGSDGKKEKKKDKKKEGDEGGEIKEKKSKEVKSEKPPKHDEDDGGDDSVISKTKKSNKVFAGKPVAPRERDVSGGSGGGRSSSSSSSSSDEDQPDFKFPKNFQLLNSDMPEKQQRRIFRWVLEAERKHTNSLPERAKYVKQRLDKTIEPVWHVVVVIGQFASFVSQVPHCSFNFKYGRNIYLMWKTP